MTPTPKNAPSWHKCRRAEEICVPLSLSMITHMPAMSLPMSKHISMTSAPAMPILNGRCCVAPRVSSLCRGL